MNTDLQHHLASRARARIDAEKFPSIEEELDRRKKIREGKQEGRLLPGMVRTQGRDFRDRIVKTVNPNRSKSRKISRQNKARRGWLAQALWRIRSRSQRISRQATLRAQVEEAKRKFMEKSQEEKQSNG